MAKKFITDSDDIDLMESLQGSVLAGNKIAEQAQTSESTFDADADAVKDDDKKAKKEKKAKTDARPVEPFEEEIDEERAARRDRIRHIILDVWEGPSTKDVKISDDLMSVIRKISKAAGGNLQAPVYSIVNNILKEYLDTYSVEIQDIIRKSQRPKDIF